jgi:hypothetical protein
MPTILPVNKKMRIPRCYDGQIAASAGIAASWDGLGFPQPLILEAAFRQGWRLEG